MILGLEGEILGHAGQATGLADDVIDAVGDATAETLQRAARPDPPPQTTETDDHVAQVGSTQICAASLGKKAVLVVVFDDTSNLSLVRLRMKRARELILRSLEAA